MKQQTTTKLVAVDNLWARCAVPNASLTYTSPSFDSEARNSSTFFGSAFSFTSPQPTLCFTSETVVNFILHWTFHSWVIMCLWLLPDLQYYIWKQSHRHYSWAMVSKSERETGKNFDSCATLSWLVHIHKAKPRQEVVNHCWFLLLQFIHVSFCV